MAAGSVKWRFCAHKLRICSRYVFVHFADSQDYMLCIDYIEKHGKYAYEFLNEKAALQTTKENLSANIH